MLQRLNINPVIVFSLLVFFVPPIVGFWASYYIAGWKALLIANALSGAGFFELAWFVGQRFRDGDDERDDLFPAFRRTDVKNWYRLKFYPFAVTVFWLRTFMALGSFCFCCVCIKFVLFGHDFRKPLTGTRRKVKEFLYWFFMNVLMLAAFMPVFNRHEEMDYSEYLGPDYKKTQKVPKTVPTFIANHQAWIDNITLTASPHLMAGYAAKKSTGKVWFLNAMIRGLHSLMITRGGTPEERDKQIQEIIDRQQLCMDDPRFPPIIIYPEGSQSNGTSLLTFKKGAFVSMLPVTPVVLKYKYMENGVNPAWDSMPFLAQAPLQFCYGLYSVTVHILPPFVPNEYLLKKHADKGSEEWEIFAWAVRDIMAKFGNFRKDESSLKDKLAYKDFMAGNYDQFTYKGKVIKAKPFWRTKPKIMPQPELDGSNQKTEQDKKKE